MDKLRIFERFKGDIDMFGRVGRANERDLLPDDEWYLLETLLQDAIVIVRKLGSEQRNEQAMTRITENSENQEVIDELMRLAANS